MSMQADGLAWVTDADNNDWAENVAAQFRVHRTDENEIVVETHLWADGEYDESTAASIYLTLGEASRLAHLLGVAVLAHEAAAHEAAKL